MSVRMVYSPYSAGTPADRHFLMILGPWAIASHSAPYGPPGRHSLSYAAGNSFPAADRQGKDKRAPDGNRLLRVAF